MEPKKLLATMDSERIIHGGSEGDQAMIAVSNATLYVLVLQGRTSERSKGNVKALYMLWKACRVFFDVIFGIAFEENNFFRRGLL